MNSSGRGWSLLPRREQPAYLSERWARFERNAISIWTIKRLPSLLRPRLQRTSKRVICADYIRWQPPSPSVSAQRRGETRGNATLGTRSRGIYRAGETLLEVSTVGTTISYPARVCACWRREDCSVQMKPQPLVRKYPRNATRRTKDQRRFRWMSCDV